MGIWIRSQDKCKMGKCAEFYIDDSYDGDYDIEGYRHIFNRGKGDQSIGYDTRTYRNT